MMTCDNKECETDTEVALVKRFSIWMIHARLSSTKTDVLDDAPSKRILNIDLCLDCRTKFKSTITNAVAEMIGI